MRKSKSEKMLKSNSLYRNNENRGIKIQEIIDASEEIDSVISELPSAQKAKLSRLMEKITDALEYVTRPKTPNKNPTRSPSLGHDRERVYIVKWLPNPDDIRPVPEPHILYSMQSVADYVGLSRTTIYNNTRGHKWYHKISQTVDTRYPNHRAYISTVMIKEIAIGEEAELIELGFESELEKVRETWLRQT